MEGHSLALLLGTLGEASPSMLSTLSACICTSCVVHGMSWPMFGGLLAVSAGGWSWTADMLGQAVMKQIHDAMASCAGQI